MKDKEILKALECCKLSNDEGCLNCPLNSVSLPECSEILFEETINLINRQQAEIEDLNHGIDALGRVKEQLKEILTETESKYQKEITRLDALLVCKNKVIRGLEKSFENAYDGAIKEFAERLKNSLKGYGGLYCRTTMNVRIDNLVKEMVGEDK